MNLRLGTRTSKMALYQASLVKDLLYASDSSLSIEIVPIKSDGNCSVFEGKGKFVKNIDTALITGEIDFSVNCMKDIPNDHERTKGIKIFSTLSRGDMRDALILGKLTSLDDLDKKNVVIGSSSPRRKAILKNIYPMSSVRDIKGNADTRVSKLENGDYDALVLSTAGLIRIGLEHKISKIYSVDEFTPALGSGIITMDSLCQNTTVKNVLRKINDHETYYEMIIERSILNQINGNCETEIGCYYTKEKYSQSITVRANISNQVIEIKQSYNMIECPYILGTKIGEKILKKALTI